MLIAEIGGVRARPTFHRWITAEGAAGVVDLLALEAEPWADPVEAPPATGDPGDGVGGLVEEAVGLLLLGDVHAHDGVQPVEEPAELDEVLDAGPRRGRASMALSRSRM
jgi:hypothetical protein